MRQPGGKDDPLTTSPQPPLRPAHKQQESSNTRLLFPTLPRPRLQLSCASSLVVLTARRRGRRRATRTCFLRIKEPLMVPLLMSRPQTPDHVSLLPPVGPLGLSIISSLRLPHTLSCTTVLDGVVNNDLDRPTYAPPACRQDDVLSRRHNTNIRKGERSKSSCAVGYPSRGGLLELVVTSKAPSRGRRESNARRRWDVIDGDSLLNSSHDAR